MSKRTHAHADDELATRAERLFGAAKGGVLLTGQGLARHELRRLERQGIVVRQLMKHKKSGALIHAWVLTPPPNTAKHLTSA